MTPFDFDADPAKVAAFDDLAARVAQWRKDHNLSAEIATGLLGECLTICLAHVIAEKRFGENPSRDDVVLVSKVVARDLGLSICLSTCNAGERPVERVRALIGPQHMPFAMRNGATWALDTLDSFVEAMLK